MEVSVSFLKSKYSMLDQIKRLNASNCDLIHVDFMDGSFVNNISLTLENMHLEQFNKPIEIHLMVNKPLDYLEYCMNFKPKYFIIHYEIFRSVDEMLKTVLTIIDKGIRVGLAINSETDIKEIKPILKYFDMILVMSVTPGKGGQPFLNSTVLKLQTLRKVYKGRIEVDGGINDVTVSLVKPYVDAVVSGSYICLSDDYNKNIARLKA